MLKLLSDVNAKSIILFCHHNADPDAIFSAYALSKLLRKMMPKVKVEIATPQGLSKLSKHVLRSIPTRVVTSPIVEEADAIILLDINNLQRLNSFGKRVGASEKPVIVIDHHPMHPETENISALRIINEHASSTCEIVFELFKQASVKPDAKEAQALFIGIAYDTRHFSIATSNTFKVAAELIGLGARAEDALFLLEMPLDPSERIARLKAAGRSRLVRAREWLIVLSDLGSYQASAARALVGLGAHVAIIGGKRGEMLRVNMRSSREFFSKTKIHLGRDVAEPLGRRIGGMGGGHSTSAGVNGEGDVRPALDECMRLIRERLSSTANVS